MPQDFWAGIISDVRKIFFFALPIIVANFSSTFFLLTDNFYLSQLSSPIPLAGYGLTIAFFIIFGGILHGFMNPLVVMVSNYDAKKQYKKVGEMVRIGIYYVLIFAPIIAVVFVGIYFLLVPMGQPKEVVEIMFGFWLLYCLGALVWGLWNIMKEVLDAVQKPWLSTAFNFVMVVVNIPLGYLFILGGGGIMRPLGLFGGGIALVASDIAVLLTMYGYFFFAKSMHKYHGIKGGLGNKIKWIYQTKLNPTMRKYLIKSAIPLTIEEFFEVVSYASLGIMVGWFGTEALAGRQISNGVLETLYMIPISMTPATTIIVARAMGQKQSASVRQKAFLALAVVTLFTASAYGLVLLFGKDIAEFFGGDFEQTIVVELAVGFLLLGSLTQIVDGWQSTMLGALRGIGDFRFSSIACIIGFTLVAVPFAYIFGFWLFNSPVAILGGYMIGTAVVASILCWRFLVKTNPSKSL